MDLFTELNNYVDSRNRKHINLCYSSYLCKKQHPFELLYLENLRNGEEQISLLDENHVIKFGFNKL